MAVYPRSSWFLLLLGFSLIAATLQETTDCPTPDQVSCTTGIKCNLDGDCQNNEICCANPCYTKRCIPITKGEQDEADGPTETDCRPYIEKALKELEIGEAGHKETSDQVESAEDVPTVEITDDSSRQEEDIGGIDASDEAEGDEDKSQGSVHDDKSDEDSGETPDEKEVKKYDENPESEEETKTGHSKEESAEEIEEAEKASLEDNSEAGASQEITPDHASTGSQEPGIVKREVPAAQIEAELFQSATASEEDKKESAEKPAENTKDKEIESAEAESEEQDKKETGKSHEESTEDTAESKEEDRSKAQLNEDASRENDKSKEQAPPSRESTEEGGCPPPEEVSCIEGSLCSKHRHCGENQICCPNKCYRRRCTPGIISQAELDGESVSEESEEARSEEEPAPTIPETGCPPPNEVSCTEGDLCSGHRQCGENRICCPNKCYRKRCTPGTATSAELAEESDEVSKEESKEAAPEKVVASTTPDTGCPSPSEVSCVEGDLCSKHKHCGKNEICCPNKCYRKRCTAGVPTEEDLAGEESDEDSKEETVKNAPVEAVATKDTGCPPPSEVSCVEGDLCSKHKHCGKNGICCPNKCYRKRCTAGLPTEEDLAGEESDEDIKEENVETVPRKGIGCPERGEVPCDGEPCIKNRACNVGEICCTNKCYRKVCVTGTPDSGEEEEESEEDKKEKSAETPASAESQEDDTGCPSPDKVSCKEGERCGDDEDCSSGEICCPNKCYNKRCVPGEKGDKGESAEEEKEIPVVRVAAPKPKTEKIVPELKQTKSVRPLTEPKIEIEESVEVKEPVQFKKPEEKKPGEVRKLEAKVPVKPIVVVEPVVEEEDESSEKSGEAPVEELSLDTDVPSDLRSRDHVEHLLKLDQDSTKLEKVQNKVYEETLKELKRLYENAIKPLEVLYKYRDLSNRHFGDAEIFSKPLFLFMGPWSGGKSSIINYLLHNEYNETSLRTGAEPSPAYFNILMHGDEPGIIDGTELAADFTFSGLQKFGQGLEERLRGVKLPSKLLEKVNIVEIPGILEVRKQVSRVFPFNDACQWFIDRADIIFLVYDPSKLDVGPETEAILDQLKGREHQTRIILNKADQVKPEELMRVQGALIWNISPLMSSPQPPVMYTTSLWSRAYEPWAPTRLLQAQERAFLRDFRTAVDRRVENKIASARRFAVRVRNHAKMVDCYLTTYYNHKSVFGNRKQVANEIIERPQDYHIYEGLSTLTNISRYDLPDPDVYRDFFKLNPLYEFQQLSATCTYFRGCPINRLDIAIAYDLPELVGTYKRNLEEALAAAKNPPKEPPATIEKKKKSSAPGS